MTRPQAAKYLGVSMIRVAQLVAKYEIVELMDDGVRIYHMRDIETLAQIRMGK